MDDAALHVEVRIERLRHDGVVIDPDRGPEVGPGALVAVRAARRHAAVEVGQRQRTARQKSLVDDLGAGRDLGRGVGAGHAVADVGFGRLARLPGRRRLLRPILRPGRGRGLGRRLDHGLRLRRCRRHVGGTQHAQGHAAGSQTQHDPRFKTPHAISSCRRARPPKPFAPDRRKSQYRDFSDIWRAVARPALPQDRHGFEGIRLGHRRRPAFLAPSLRQ